MVKHKFLQSVIIDGYSCGQDGSLSGVCHSKFEGTSEDALLLNHGVVKRMLRVVQYSFHLIFRGFGLGNRSLDQSLVTKLRTW